MYFLKIIFEYYNFFLFDLYFIDIMWNRIYFGILLLVISVTKISSQSANEKFVYAKVSTKWTETPLLLEAR